MENNMNDNKNSLKQQMLIPIAILVGFGFIALSIYFSGLSSKNTETATKDSNETTTSKQAKLNPIDENDHILGNPNAPILLVEYSDFDCPYCKQYHTSLSKIMDEYGASGKVALVYRHMPLQSLHPSAPELAEASECVAKLGGNDAFWKFSNLIFEERSINEQTNMTRLDEFAETAGVSVDDFENCRASNETQDFVNEDFSNAVNMGIRGTPYTIMLIGSEQIPISGYKSYDEMKFLIDNALSNFEKTSE